MLALFWFSHGVMVAWTRPGEALFAWLEIVLSLLVGSPVFSLAGAIGAALTAGLRRGGLLLSLLVLPLFVPVVIFGAGTVTAAIVGAAGNAAFLLLAATSLFALVLAPLAAAAALRIHLS